MHQNANPHGPNVAVMYLTIRSQHFYRLKKDKMTTINLEKVEKPATEVPIATAEDHAPASKHDEFVRVADPFEVRQAKTLIWSNVSMTIVR
jgi:hypothetical protein